MRPDPVLCSHVVILHEDPHHYPHKKGSGIHLHEDLGAGKDLDGLFYLHQLLVQLSTVALGPQ